MALLGARCLALQALLLIAACRGEGAGVKVEAARVAVGDAGDAQLTVGARSLVLPPGDLAPGAAPPLAHDETAARWSYVTRSERVRVVYVVGEGLYPGPLGAEHAPRAARLEDALGELFEAAGERRARLVADVRSALGEAGMVRLLAQGADVQAPEWQAAYAALPEPRAAEVRATVLAALEPGKPMRGLRRAATLLPLAELGKRAGLAERVAEPAVQREAPKAAAVILRALATADGPRAAVVGCQTAALARSLAKEGVADAALLLEAAGLAVANGYAACPALAEVLLDAPCVPSVRCGAEGRPLDGRTASRQDEPLCSASALEAAVKGELARPSAEIGASGARPSLFALAGLTLGPTKEATMPGAFTRAHERRRYALAQPESPACEAVPAGTPCHCEEATIRDQACRREGEGLVRVGLCAFEIDDKARRLKNVVASPPP